VEPEDDGFERGSMFDPGADLKETSNELHQPSYKYGSNQKWRQSNENLYNIKHAEKIGSLDLTQAELHKYKKMAE